ncbi:MAG: hypothetical protein KDA32_09230, partial [Phycisphaerales bacterium]|nr:hypothetical protein [Phycisphaerales bacterium]
MLGLGAPGLLGAGGVGGLLGVEDASSGADYLPAFNGRGDVCQLIDASDGSLAARYEYDPFGKLIALGGAYADANPFRFSTKIADAVTGYSYFGYRDYHPYLGRW